MIPVLYGRDVELKRIDRLCAEAAAGRGGALVIRGEPGVGKSALLNTAITAVSGFDVVFGTGVESEVSLAFGGLHQLLVPLMDRLDRLTTPQADALRGALGLSDTPTTGLVVSAAVLNLLAAAARDQPLLVVVDDAHWWDRSSLASLLFAARRVEPHRIAVLIAARDPELPTSNTGDLSDLTLAALDDRASSHVLESVGHPPTTSSHQVILDAAQGNPLALVELADDWDPKGSAVDDLVLNTRLRRTFLQRTRALPAASRNLLLVAAAEEIGDLGVVLGAAARLGVPATALAAAEESAVLRCEGATVRFRHPLLRSALYQDADHVSRSEAHRAVAEEWSARGAHDRALWHRAIAADRPDGELAAALDRAGEAARRCGGVAAAVALLTRAALVSETPPDAARRLMDAACFAWQSGQLATARTLAGQARQLTPDDATSTRLTKVEGLVESSDGDPLVAVAHLAYGASLTADTVPNHAVMLLIVAAVTAHRCGDIDEALRVVRRSGQLDCTPVHRKFGRQLELAIDGVPDDTGPWQIADEVTTVLTEDEPGRWMWPMAVAWLGRDERGALDFGVVAYQQLRATGASSALTMILPWLADLELRLGRWEAGTEHAREGLRLAMDTGQRAIVAGFHALLARFAAARGDLRAVREHADATFAHARPFRDRFAPAQATWALGASLAADGDAAQAHDLLTALAEPERPQHHPHVAHWAILDRVTVALSTGEVDEAREALDVYEQWAARRTGPGVQAALHGCRGVLAETEPDQHFHFALSDPGIRQRPFDRAKIQLLYGERLRRDRRPLDARGPLRAAADLFADLGAVAWAKRAQGQLRAAGASPASADTPESAPLTPQEQLVVDLAADGLTNREIAASLYLSQKTVASHLYRAFPKLGISRRSQLRTVRPR